MRRELRAGTPTDRHIELCNLDTNAEHVYKVNQRAMQVIAGGKALRNKGDGQLHHLLYKLNSLHQWFSCIILVIANRQR